MRPKPKQHHYIPQVYLKEFADRSGFVSVYDLWQHGRLVRTTPNNVLKEKDLYTQPVHADHRFDTSFETLFSKIESKWPLLLPKIRNRVPMTEPERADLYEFVISMRVRVKNTLKAASRLLQEMAELGIGEADEPLPEDVLQFFRTAAPDLRPREGRANILASDLIQAGLLEVAVDPHRALTALPYLVQSTMPVFARVGLLSFLHNKTNLDFITSDNPCIYFFRRESGELDPYSVSPTGDFEFYFPLTPRLAIRSATFSKRSVVHRDEHSSSVVGQLNLLVAQFADRYLISGSPIDADLASAFPDVCPVPDLSRSVALPTGEVFSIAYQWGKPIRTFPKWDYGF